MGNSRYAIGIDLVGQDSTPEEIFEGVLLAKQSTIDELRFLLFCTPEVLQALQHRALPGIEFVACQNAILMHEKPMTAIKKKRESTLICGLKKLADRSIDAFLSCSNTGALVAGSVMELGVLPNVLRPALLATLPTEHAQMTVLDVGGSVQSRPQHLLQFAYLGTAYQRCVFGNENVRVGLLNIGSESEKGTQELKATLILLKKIEKEHKLPFCFVGNIEPKEAFQGNVHVLITNGFTGNIFLKTAEGIASFFMNLCFSESKEIPQVIERQLSNRISHGALVAGVDGLVVKCHGNASSMVIKNAIFGIKKHLEQSIVQSMKQFMSSSQA